MREKFKRKKTRLICTLAFALAIVLMIAFITSAGGKGDKAQQRQGIVDTNVHNQGQNQEQTTIKQEATVDRKGKKGKEIVEIVKIKNGINYLTLNDGGKMIIVKGSYVAPLIPFFNDVYTFYVDRDDIYTIVMSIDKYKNNEYIKKYTFIEAGIVGAGCSELSDEATYRSAMTIIKTAGEIFLVLAEKEKLKTEMTNNQPFLSPIYAHKGWFNLKVYFFEQQEPPYVFKEYASYKTQKEYCDAREALAKEIKNINFMEGNHE